MASNNNTNKNNNIFSVAFASHPPRPSHRALARGSPRFRPDLNPSEQKALFEIHRRSCAAQSFKENQAAAIRQPRDEIHCLRTLVLAAVQRQREHNSVALSQSIQRAAEKNLSRGVYSKEQTHEAKSNILGKASSAYNLNWIQKKLLDDVELMHTRWGFQAALTAFSQLRPFQVSHAPPSQFHRNNSRVHPEE